MGVARHFFILLRNAVFGVEEEQTDVAAIHRTKGADDAVFFRGFLNLTAAAHPRRINENIFLAVPFKGRVNGIPGRTGDIRNDGAFFTQKTVGKRGFSHIGAADQREADHIVILFFLFIGRESLNNGIEKITGIHPVQRRHGNGIAQTETVEIVIIHIVKVVDLIDRQNDGLLRFFQNRSGAHILIGQTGLSVGNHHDDIGFFNGQQDLLINTGFNGFFDILKIDPAGVDQDKLMAAPFGVFIKAVTGNAGRILHNGFPLADDSIKQR